MYQLGKKICDNNLEAAGMKEGKNVLSGQEFGFRRKDTCFVPDAVQYVIVFTIHYLFLHLLGWPLSAADTVMTDRDQLYSAVGQTKQHPT